MSLLDELHLEIMSCEQCPLHAGRTNAVPGEGSPDADIMFIGEGPGAEEDAQGRPFVGRSGKLLTMMLDQVGFERGEVFIGNVVKCRPPENRTPLANEVEACRHYLQAQLALIRPRVIVTLGVPALQAFFGQKYKLSSVVGRFIRSQGQLFFATWHPSYVLRAQRNRPDYLRHFKKLRGAKDRDFKV
ncbi:uracil-DNA glycosylase [bacterium]|nr:uracil-DNA glycosylase [bacterium]